MIPTRADITALALTLLGDTAVAGGSIYTSAFQASLLNAAYMEMVSRLAAASGDKVQREMYYVLPAYTGALAPATFGATSFGFPEEIRERSITGQYAISAITPASPSAGLCAVATSQAMPTLPQGQMLEVYNPGGISEDINSSWACTINSTTSIVLNGCTATGTYTSAGFVVYSGLDWSDPLDMHDTTDLFPPNSVGSALGMYSWQRSILRFPPCSTARELKIVFNLSGSLPVISSPVTTDSMGIDDSLNFLAHRTAQLCATSKGNPRAATFQQQADYFLGIMLAGAARAMQSGEAIIPRPFRGKRNIRQVAW